MTEKNIFVLYTFFLLNISDFILFFMWKLKPILKSPPPLSQKPHSKNWDPVKPPLFENLVGGSTPSPQQKVMVHTMVKMGGGEGISWWNWRNKFAMVGTLVL